MNTAAPTLATRLAQAILPLYRSHKIVAAARITAITRGDPTSNLVLQLPDGSSMSQLVSAEYMEKHRPAVGGYYVRYADGYESWSPSDTFEDGYQPVSAAQAMGSGASGDSLEAKIERIARTCHEVNRAYCLGLGDDSQQPWERAPDWQRESARNGVRLHLEHPDAGAQASHEAWMREKLATGWKLGPVKDADKKEHPCLVPFHELPQAQQMKDHIFRGVVHALA